MESEREILRKNHLKSTPTREAVLSLLKSNHSPFSVEDIYTSIECADKVTIYRTVKDLALKGIINQVDLGASRAYFEYSHSHHHHLVCTNCEKVEDFNVCNLGGLERKILSQSKNFTQITRHSFEIFGICKNCTRN